MSKVLDDFRAWLDDLSPSEFGNILWLKDSKKGLLGATPKFCKKLSHQQMKEEIDDVAIYHFERQE